MNLGLALTHPSRAVHAMAMIFGIIGAASSSPRVHAGIATLAYVVRALWALTTGMVPAGGMHPGG